MEPKPLFEWEDYGKGRFFLRVDHGKRDGYGIVIFRPYRSDGQPWRAVSDYESDYPDFIASSDDLNEVKRAAEREWFNLYFEDR